MDKETTFQDVKDKIKDFTEKRNWDQFHNAKDLSIGIITESSELLEHFRFKPEDEIETFFNDPKKKEEICDELSDVFIFALRFAYKYNIDVTDAIRHKMEKNDKKYPAEKFKGVNKKYNEI